MKRYTVIAHKAQNNEHLNEQELLPASCKFITGIVVFASSKQAVGLEGSIQQLSFPQGLITRIFQQKNIDLFYSYLRTRENEQESRAFFESGILPPIIQSLSDGVIYACLNPREQIELTGKLVELLDSEFSDYIYKEKKLFSTGQNMGDIAFAEYIAGAALQFLYDRQKEIFTRTVHIYNQSEPYECGNISLLINGNNFLLRDFSLTANRKIRSLKNEIFPLHEPLEVNSNVHTVFKNAKNNGNKTLAIKTVIQYEPDK